MKAKEIARKIAAESIVLLKNDGNLLPLQEGKSVAIFGRSQFETILSGNGSGAANAKNPKNLVEQLERNQIIPIKELADFYRVKSEKELDMKPENPHWLEEAVYSGLIYEIFGQYTPPSPEYILPKELVNKARQETDTALLILGRQTGGEECDRHVHDDFYLTESEKLLISQVCTVFPKVILILNLNDLIDLRWTREYESIRSILFIGIPGEEGPAALADILIGVSNPSGKLAFTIAENYEDYPAHTDFSWDKDHPENIKSYADYGLDAVENGSVGFSKSPVTVYTEDIYMGYRYFNSFGIKPMFPFGFGLSYTDFSIDSFQLSKSETALLASATVTNTGKRNGKQVVQLYVSAVGTASKRVYQELKGFVKTKDLSPEESQTVTITVPITELSCYREAPPGWVIEKGNYIIRLGTSSAMTTPVGLIRVEKDIVVQQTDNRLAIQECNRGKTNFLVANSSSTIPTNLPTLTISPEEAPIWTTIFHDNKKAQFEDYSIEQLASLCVGYGSGVPFDALQEIKHPSSLFDKNGKPITTNSHPAGRNGYISPAMTEKGIYSISYKDGPASVGETAWPTEMLLCCSFDTKLCNLFGNAIGEECEHQQVDVWLAPTVNMRRHPLGGRNFEYPSEDPILAGLCISAVVDGVQKNHHVLACAKHFAANEQETYRRGSTKLHYDAVDSIASERALRELYLKPFEMLVKNAGIKVIMTSFNKINGTFAGGNKDLCTHILREEWGFNGLVVTDWGDMDTVVDGANAVAAGNDVVMPGGPPVIHQILQGYSDGRITRSELELAVSHLFEVLRYFGRC